MIIPMLPQDAYQALAQMSGQGATFVEGTPLSSCCNKRLAVELVTLMASQIALIFVVINYQYKITINVESKNNAF